MEQPVTTNPIIIMLINMTVVFIVLSVLMYVIKLIHIIDPTKPKENKEESSVEEKSREEKSPVLAEPVAVGIPDEVVAAIAAAVVASGTTGVVRSIRPIERNGWKNSGRVSISSWH